MMGWRRPISNPCRSVEELEFVPWVRQYSLEGCSLQAKKWPHLTSFLTRLLLATVWDRNERKVGGWEWGTKAEARRPTRRLLKITHPREEDGGLDQNVNSDDGENWSYSILELGGRDLLSDWILPVRERGTSRMMPVFLDWAGRRVALSFTEMGRQVAEGVWEIKFG